MTPGYDKAPLQLVKEDGVLPELRISSEGSLWTREQKLMAPPTTGLWSLWLDGSLKPKAPLRELVEDWLKVADMAVFRHPHRTCAYAEIDACVKRNKITAKQGEKARSHLLLSGFPSDFGLWALGVIARRVHCNPTQQFVMPLVWELFQECPRDQIWFPFALWKLLNARKRIHTIDADIFDNPWFSFRRHGT